MPTRPKPPKQSRLYSRIGARGWRESAYFTFSVRSLVFRRWLAARLPAPRLKILSAGCGSGELEAHLAERGQNVVGLDLSLPMLRRARKRGLDALVQADSQALPFRAGSFDVVIFPECIGYLDLPTAFTEAARVLRKRGRLLITTYCAKVKLHAGYVRADLAEIAAALAAAGFRVAEHRFLDAKRTSVTAVSAAAEATLLYIVARPLAERRRKPTRRPQRRLGGRRRRAAPRR